MPEGKTIVRQNNLQQGYHSREPVFEDTAEIRAFMRSLRRQGSGSASGVSGPVGGGGVGAGCVQGNLETFLQIIFCSFG